MQPITMRSLGATAPSLPVRGGHDVGNASAPPSAAAVPLRNSRREGAATDEDEGVLRVMVLLRLAN